jgi:hypothetical protein
MASLIICSAAVMLLSLICSLSIFVGETYTELILNLPRNHALLSVSELLILSLLISYLFSSLLCYAEISKNSIWENKMKLFWKKIIFLKPVSGITAYGLLSIAQGKMWTAPIIIRTLFNFRIMFFSTSIISLLILFIFAKPMKMFAVIFFFCIAGTIMTDLIYEALILFHASRKDKREWDDFDYYSYFTSLTSIFNPFSYSEYYRRQFRRE